MRFPRDRGPVACSPARGLERALRELGPSAWLLLLACATAMACEGSQDPGDLDAGTVDAAPPTADASGSDGGPLPGGSLIVASWALEHIGVPGILLDCASAGTPDVMMEVVARESNQRSSKSFTCAGSLGFSDAVLPGRYDVAVGLLDQAAQPVAIFSVQDLLVQPRMAVTLPPIVFAVQAFWPKWTISRAAAPTTAIACGAAGAVQVDLVVTAPGAAPVRYIFPCAATDPYTPAIRLGTYEVRAELLGPGSVVLAQWTSPPVTATDADRAALDIRFSLP